ncbi:MAG: hypothetical protein RL743_693 [Actinomycetota bacterium]
MTRSFAVTWDYRCPYGRIVHDHVVTGLLAGADWNVTFLPYCLGQSNRDPGLPPIWETPQADSGLFALQVGVAARDADPARFPTFHHAVYEYRHTRAGNLNDRDAIAAMLTDAGLDASTVFDHVESGEPLRTIAREHMQYVNSHDVWGVPTFVVDDKAVFVRLLRTSDGNAETAIATIDRILDNIDWPILNEFKHTSVPQ